MSILKKAIKVLDKSLDQLLEKSTSNTSPTESPKIAMNSKGLIEMDHTGGQPNGYKERAGVIGPQVMKAMARKDSIVSAIHQTRLHQFNNFSEYQKDKYSPGWILTPVDKIEYTPEEELMLADPELQADDDAFKAAKFEIDSKLSERRNAAIEDAKKIKDWIECCGWDAQQFDLSKRMDFPTLCGILVRNRLTYNHVAVETVPTKDAKRIHHIFPVDSGTIRLVARHSALAYSKTILEDLIKRGERDVTYKLTEPFRYVQIVRGQIRAAWTEKEMIYIAANPSVDPEDQGYAFGEMEMLVQIITAHLYAEAHNRNFFTQGIGSKGILHIKGENISRAQLEGFKRQWLNQATNSKNAFRPPVIGMADDVKWVELSQNNRDMEFDSWMHYLIKITCAVYQIDPSEINFDITKANSSTLNESNNEQRLKSSRDKGLNSLLKFIQDIMNKHILPRWDADLAKRFKFEFVGLYAESREQEVERFQKEVQTWKTVNEIRKEMEFPPIDDGDIIMNGAYTQYLQMQMQKEMTEGEAMEDPEQQDDASHIEESDADPINLGGDEDEDSTSSAADSIVSMMDDLSAKDAEDQKAKEEKDKKVEKSIPHVVEWYIGNKDED